MENILHYFPDLSPVQIERFASLEEIYTDWNSKINVISRKDIEHFYTRHVLHSLSIGLVHPFAQGSRIIDVGTGGGFPGIPLAILFPDVEFTLVDSIRKKIKVVDEVSQALGLKNVRLVAERMEKVQGRYDFVIGRAVTELPRLYNWTKRLVNWNKGKQNGMIYIKGGDFYDELDQLPLFHEIHYLNTRFDDEFFETKKVIHLFK